MNYQQDYFLFLYGFSLIITALGLRDAERQPGIRLKWRWVSYALFVFGVSNWIEIPALLFENISPILFVRIFMNLAAYLLLAEFVRTGLEIHGTRVPGRWVHFMLLGVVLSGGIWGLAGVQAASLGLVAIPASLLATGIIVREGLSRKRYFVLLGAVLFFLFSLLSLVSLQQVLMARRTGFLYVSDIVKVENTWELPVLVAFSAGLVLAISIFLGRRVSGRGAWFRRWVIPGLLAGMLVLGGWFTGHRGNVAAQAYRDQLLHQGMSLASALQPQVLESLLESNLAESSPAFERVSSYFSDYALQLGFHQVYSFMIQEGEFMPGPNSGLPGKEVVISPAIASQDWQARPHQEPLIVEPYLQGEVFLASLVIHLPWQENEAKMLYLGLDVYASDWVRAVRWERIQAILLTLLEMSLLLLFIYLFDRRTTHFSSPERWLRFSDILFILVAGISITVAVAHYIWENELYARSAAFQQMAEVQVGITRSGLADGLLSDLESLTRFFESSKIVSYYEFTRFAEPLVRTGIAQAWEWIPRVPEADLDNLEQQARAQGLVDFQVKEMGAAGALAPVESRSQYFPVLYVAPLAGNEEALGYDLGSDAQRLQALQQAWRVGRRVASAPVVLVQETGSQKAVLVVEPVFANSGPDSTLQGFTLAVLRMGTFLDWVTKQSQIPQGYLEMGLYRLDAQGGQELVAATSSSPEHILAAQQGMFHHSSDLYHLAPLFFAGESYVIVVHPGDDFYRLNPLRDGWVAASIGLLLTIVSSVFGGFIIRRQVDLERLVRERTLALQQSEEKFASAFHASGVLMAISELDTGRYVDVNEAFCEVIGYKKEEVIGSTAEELGLFRQEGFRETFLQQLGEKGSLHGVEFQAFTRSGELREGLISMEIIDLNGKPHLLSALLDITEQKRSEVALQTAQKLADLGTLSAGVAHELNTPLQIITGAADSLLSALDGGNGQVDLDRQKRYLVNISRSAWRMSEIVRTLNIYARRNQEEIAEYDLNELVKDALILLEHQLHTQANIRLETRLASVLPTLHCNRNDITQILINLISNARDAMPSGGIIKITTAYDPARQALQLSVGDTGSGMPAEILDKIFNPFFTTKPVGKGTGLGLSIVHGLVQHYGGSVEVQSEPGRGTVFHLLFPQNPPPASSDADAEMGRYR